MKVLMLGAGASKPADYPTANKLMSAIEADTKACMNDGLMSAWMKWQETKACAPGALGLLLDDPNPEVILSVLDLCRISSFAAFEKQIPLGNRDESVSDALADGKVRDSCFTSAHYRWLDAADAARRRLLECLIAYFDWLHYSDRVKQECRAYLSEKLEKLSSGDFVITFNWDTLVKSKWMLGDDFSLVDCDYGPVLNVLEKARFSFADFPRIQAYLDAFRSRPSWQATPRLPML